MGILSVMLVLAVAMSGCDFISSSNDVTDGEEVIKNYPHNLRIEEVNGEKHLVWDWDGDLDETVFVILRSSTDDSDEAVSPDSTEETKYPLAELDGGYYYWVRAYVDGSNTDVGDSIYIE